MKESYIEILARNNGPESCVDVPRGHGEALTGESIGQTIELRNHQFPDGIPSGLRGTRNGVLRYRKRHPALAESKNLGMCGHSPRGNREISGRSLAKLEVLGRGIAGKVNRRIPAMNSPEKSDDFVVPEKFANKEASASAEQMEERKSTKRKSVNETAERTLSRIVASNEFTGCVVGIKRKQLRYRFPLKTPLLEVGAVCVNVARTDLCGGRLVTAVPTAT
jgi:hypothetical protein